jgi:hypothetical protein
VLLEAEYSTLIQSVWLRQQEVRLQAVIPLRVHRRRQLPPRRFGTLPTGSLRFFAGIAALRRRPVARPRSAI